MFSTIFSMYVLLKRRTSKYGASVEAATFICHMIVDECRILNGADNRYYNAMVIAMNVILF